MDFLFINENPDRDYSTAQPVLFKIRHQPEFNKGTMITLANGRYTINSENMISGIAPGQFAVIYTTDKSICLGSGVIA